MSTIRSTPRNVEGILTGVVHTITATTSQDGSRKLLPFPGEPRSISEIDLTWPGEGITDGRSTPS